MASRTGPRITFYQCRGGKIARAKEVVVGWLVGWLCFAGHNEDLTDH